MGDYYLLRTTLGVPRLYSVTASPDDGLFVAGTPTDRWIGTQNINGLILTFSLGTTAIALYGVTSDDQGNPAPGETVSMMFCTYIVSQYECVNESYVSTIGDSDFRGFISQTNIDFGRVYTQSSANVAISELQIANAVPEPGTYALALAALAGVGLRARRRRAP